jgi:hypothetical protein
VDETLRLAKEAASRLGIRDVVVASTRGFTAEKALEAFEDTDVVLTMVGIDQDRFDQDLRGKLEEQGHGVCFSHEVSYEYPDLVVAAYRRFCEGVKVAVEIPMIAADAGLISTDQDVVSVGKWDTAMVITPATSDNFSALRVRELLCKPW